MALRLLATAAVIAFAVLGANWVALHRVVARSLSSDPRNEGIRIWAYYRYGLDPRQAVLDLRGVSDSNSRMDVFRVLLQFAESQKDRRYDSVMLAYRGRPRFVIPGDYFRTLGEEYDLQNPVYTARTFPSRIRRPDGRPAFPPREGGLLSVLTEELNDQVEFHDEWYLNDILAGR